MRNFQRSFYWINKDLNEEFAEIRVDAELHTLKTKIVEEAVRYNDRGRRPLHFVRVFFSGKNSRENKLDSLFSTRRFHSSCSFTRILSLVFFSLFTARWFGSKNGKCTFSSKRDSSKIKIVRIDESASDSSNSNLSTSRKLSIDLAGQAELTTAHIMRVVNSVVPTLPNRRNRRSPSCTARN